MNKKIYLDKILKVLLDGRDIDIPDSLNEKIELWENLVFDEDLQKISDTVLIDEDKFLRLDLINRKLTDGEKLRTIDVTIDSKIKYSNKISLWKGDITTIYADVLVNSTTKDMLGLNVEKGTIDYDIFLRSGMRLRKKCNEILQGKELEFTEVLITRAYNIPGDFIIHVVVPDFDSKEKKESLVSLKMCYMNVLECAKNNMARTIVLPCLGTGKHGFNKEESAKIAIEAVNTFLKKNEKEIDKIVFNVFEDENYNIYKELLTGEKDA